MTAGGTAGESGRKKDERNENEKATFENTEDLLSELEALQNCDSYECTRPRQRHLGIKHLQQGAKQKTQFDGYYTICILHCSCYAKTSDMPYF